MATGPIFHDSPERPQTRTSPALGEEPWYYRFLVLYAYGVMGLGLLIGAPLVGWAILSVARAENPSYGPAILVGLAWPLSLVFGSMAVGTPILLAVDAARNLRAMRGR